MCHSLTSKRRGLASLPGVLEPRMSPENSHIPSWAPAPQLRPEPVFLPQWQWSPESRTLLSPNPGLL